MNIISGQISLFDSDKGKYSEHKKYRSGIFKTKQGLEEELRKNGVDKIYYVLSFGGGTQSTHLFEDHLQGKIHYDYIIMSDTGAEPAFIYNQVHWWQERQKLLGNKTPFLITCHSSMSKGLEEMFFRYIYTNYQRFQLPIFCSKLDEGGKEKPAGMMKRQCTVDFKIIPVKKLIRQLILKDVGLNPNQMMPRNIAVIIDIGFSLDEINRINGYQGMEFKYMYYSYPLVEANQTTDDSIKFLRDNGMPIKRSRCYLCPFNCDKKDIGMDWKEIIEFEPLSFLKACWFDEQLRNVQKTGTKVMHSIPYLHYSRKPLKEVYKKDYENLMSIYQDVLYSWVQDWISYINLMYKENREVAAA